MSTTMDGLQTSKFRLYGIGTVASDLIMGDKPIKVYVHEILANTEGDIEETEVVNKVVKDSSGKSHNVSITEGKLIEGVIWATTDSNRVTPPNVRKGEKVEVYQYGDFNKFYWRKLGIELDLRRLEHVTHVYVNTDDEEEKVIDGDNSYWTTISTLNKVIRIHTSDNDGELTTYDLTIDTKTGYYEFIDGRGNYSKLDSATDTWTHYANQDIIHDAGNDINLIAGNSINLTAGVSINLVAPLISNVAETTITMETPIVSMTYKKKIR